LLVPKATEKSWAARVDDDTYGGFTKEVTVPIEPAIVNVKVSPGWSVPDVVGVEEKQRIALVGCPAENSVGVMPIGTLLLVCAETLCTGMSSDSRANRSRDGNKIGFVRIALFAKCASLLVI
jgi:hypothetical protein